MTTVATGVSTLELTKKAYQNFNEGNVPALVEMFHQDIAYHIMGTPDLPFAGTFKGKEQVLGFFKKLDETVQFTKFEVQEYITEGDKVVAIVDVEGRAKSTGKSFKTIIAHLIKFQEGKVLSFRDFSDTREMSKALQ